MGPTFPPAASAAAPDRRRRDLWALAAPPAALMLLARAWGAPLGVPVADDFDFLHVARFADLDLTDGGGSNRYWRPLSQQIYYRALARPLVESPWLMTALHVLLLALAAERGHAL